MKLSILERYSIWNMLPQAGELLYIRTVAQLRDVLLPSDDETEAWNVRQEGDNILWDTKLAQDVEVAFTARQTTCIEDQLRRLETEKALTVNHLSLWDKFFPVEDESQKDDKPVLLRGNHRHTG